MNKPFYGGGGNRTRGTFPRQQPPGSGSRAHARQVDSDRLTVTFHPSLPEHAQRLLATLDIDVRYDDTVDEHCHCGAHTIATQNGGRTHCARCLRDELRRKLNANVCPIHNERLVQHGQVCRACQREAMSPTEQAV